MLLGTYLILLFSYSDSIIYTLIDMLNVIKNEFRILLMYKL